MVFVTVNHVPATGEAGRALEARFRARQRLVDTLPGFRSFEVLRPIPSQARENQRGGEYLAMTAWGDRRAFDNWRMSAAQRPVRPARGGPLAQADAGSWFTMHESVATAYRDDWQAVALAAEAPIAAMNVVDVARDHAGTFEEAWTSRQKRLDEQQGFLALEVLRTILGEWDGPETVEPVQPPATTYVVLTRWRSGEDLRAWMSGPGFGAAHAGDLPEGAILRSGAGTADILQPSYGQNV